MIKAAARSVTKSRHLREKPATVLCQRYGFEMLGLFTNPARKIRENQNLQAGFRAFRQNIIFAGRIFKNRIQQGVTIAWFAPVFPVPKTNFAVARVKSLFQRFGD